MLPIIPHYNTTPHYNLPEALELATLESVTIGTIIIPNLNYNSVPIIIVNNKSYQFLYSLAQAWEHFFVLCLNPEI